MLLALMSLAAGGPWVQPPGTTYSKVDAAGFRGLVDSSRGANRFNYSDLRLQGYAEVGLSRKIQSTWVVPLVYGVNDNGDERFAGLTGGDVEVGVTRSLSVQPVSVEVRLRIPTYFGVARSRVTRLGNGVGENLPIPGEAAFALETWLHGGASLSNGGSWIQGSVAYRHRFMNRSDGMVFDGAIGVQPAGGWCGLGISGVANFRDDSLSQQFLAVRAFGAIPLNPTVRLEAAIQGLPFAGGSGTTLGVGASLGISYRGRLWRPQS